MGNAESRDVGEDSQGRWEPGPVRRLVVKLGSSTVTSEAFEPLIDGVESLRREGVQVTVVSSGAVAEGRLRVQTRDQGDDLARIQALAAVGQAALMGRFNEAFGRHDTPCAQILLTHEDLSHRRHVLNIRHTLEAALSMGIVPVVNENDTVATAELRFGDNDRLAAALGTVIDADLIVLLSDVDGVYDGDPRVDPDARPIKRVTRIDDGLRDRVGRSTGPLGTGGMASKLGAAELAMGAGIPLVVARGDVPDVLSRVVRGEAVGTLFVPPISRLDRRRHWIGFLSKVCGTLQVDAGAVRALQHRGSSLLPIGVTGVEGQFERGDGVRIVGPDGQEIGRGLVGYPADQARAILGHRLDEVPSILGHQAADALVHRNDLVLAESDQQNG